MGEMAGGAALGAGSDRESVRLEPAVTAWLAAIPCALVTALAVLFLGPPTSHLLFPPSDVGFLPGETQTITPEPLENARYLILLAGPVLLASAVPWVNTRRIVAPRRSLRAGVVAAQIALVAVALACLLAQHDDRWGYAYFNWTTLAVASLLAAVTVLAIRIAPAAARARTRNLLRDDRGRGLALLGVAGIATAIWLLPAVDSETSVRWAFMAHDAQFHFDETFAVLNGLTPLVDFNAQYASLLPYLIAVAMRASEPTFLVFTLTVCTLSLLALLCVYDVIRRATGSAALALALYLPFMATSLFYIGGLPLIRFTPGVYFPMFPLRYCGPFVLAWLVARHLDGVRSRNWPLFVAAGFAVLNNVEFGVAAFGAVVGALAATARPWSARRLLRLAGAAAAGLATAFAVYAIVTLGRAGGLPHPERLTQFARLYGVAGYSVAPIVGLLGLPLVMFGTHVAAIVTAMVRTCSDEPNRVLTGTLMWTGLFGLGSATYYVARSSASILPMLFSAWAFSLVLLAVAVLHRMAAQPTRLPSAPSVAVLFAVGLMACSLAQVPAPWQQIERVREQPALIGLRSTRWIPPSHDPEIRTFVSSLADGPHRFVVRQGAPVAIFATMGHRLADAYGVVDVVPYTGFESIHTRGQMADSLDALRTAGGNTALVPLRAVRRLGGALRKRGFAVLTYTGLRRPGPRVQRLPADTVVLGGFTKWVDMRHLQAAALTGH